MGSDSPVTFPKSGALPAKFPPDVKVQRLPAEKDYYIFGTPERSLEQIKRIQAEMPYGEFSVTKTDWRHLERTHTRLATGGPMRVLDLGDSIVNDTMRSGWLAKLQEAYPKSKIEGMVYVRGGGGGQHYREQNRIQEYLAPLKPDMVFIGGISQKDIASIREVIHQIRAELPNVEFLLATGVFGSTDPRDATALAKASHSGTGDFGKALKQLAEEERCAFLDMTTPWVDYLKTSGLHPHRFYRDAVHANEYGEQVLSKILMSCFAP